MLSSGQDMGHCAHKLTDAVVTCQAGSVQDQARDIPEWVVEGLPSPCPFLRSYRQLLAAGERSHLLQPSSHLSGPQSIK